MLLFKRQVRQVHKHRLPEGQARAETCDGSLWLVFRVGRLVVEQTADLSRVSTLEYREGFGGKGHFTFTPDHQLLVKIEEHRMVIYAVDTGRIIRIIDAGCDRGYGCLITSTHAFLPRMSSIEGFRLADGSRSHLLRCDVPGLVWHVSSSRDQTMIYGSIGRRFICWDLETGAVRGTCVTPIDWSSIRKCPSDNVVIAAYGPRLEIYSPTLELLERHIVPGHFTGMFSTRLVFTSSGVYNLDTCEIVRLFEPEMLTFLSRVHKKFATIETFSRGFLTYHVRVFPVKRYRVLMWFAADRAAKQ